MTPSADGRTLTVGLPGGSCETTWGGLVSEAGGVVVVGGWMYNPNPDQACAGVLLLRKVTVHLAAPLGDRVVLDGATGQPATREPGRPVSGGDLPGPRVGSGVEGIFLPAGGKHDG